MSQNDFLLTFSGELSKEKVAGLETAMSADTIYTVDFAEVTDINFAALRAILNCRKSGKRFIIINACDKVAGKFEDTGVSSFVNICRKPKPLDMSKYQEFGASFMSTAYKSLDGDSMIKCYGSRVSKAAAAQEKAVARAVLQFGINTPLVGTLYEDGQTTAIDFERIEGKRSLSRIISEEPERMEEITTLFAKMCKELHSTPCDTTIFNDKKSIYRFITTQCAELNDEEKARILAFIDTIPDATTCLHGDMQPSNVITTGEETMWIDLSDFGYGYPLMDLGMLYFLTNLTPEDHMVNLFHLSKAKTRELWEIFVREYFDARTPEQLAAAERELLPYTALHMLYLGTSFGFEPFMMPVIKGILLR